jgi:uncharacterized Zn finger protein
MPTYGQGGYRGFDSFPASKPLPAEGGIASSKTRGAMATTWWSMRFTDVLESYGLGGRMTRGKSYARKGQVLSLSVANGVMSAEVQGSRSKPYDVTVTMKPPSDAQWALIEELLQARVGYAAAMLAGEIPTDLETLFVDAGCSLFPSDWRSLRATCSCPDWGDPCKHQAAVLYVFADQLDADPWQLLQWHGRSQHDVLALFSGGVGPASDVAWTVPPWWPLRVDPTAAATEAPRRDLALPEAADEPGAVLRRLAPLDVSLASGESVGDILAALYESLRVE